MEKKKIGILISVNLDSALTHDLFSRILDSFKTYSEQSGYTLSFINSTNKYLVKHSIVDQVAEDEMSGVFIATGNYEAPEIKELLDSDTPTVTIDYKSPKSVSVSSDNVMGIKELVKYVIEERHHKRLAFISGDAESPVSQLRLKQFLATAEEFGVSIPREYICESRFRDMRLVARRTEELLNLEIAPTCIFFPDDFSAIGGINVIHNRGLDVPKDISFCGYDGVNLVSFLDPQICTVVQDTENMGVTAAKELIKLMEEGRPGDGSEIIIPTRIQHGHTVSLLH